jgi:hypothetical protein
MDNEEEVKSKRLIPVTMDYDEQFKTWSMRIENGNKYNFRASEDMVHKLLKKCRTKDSITLPASRKKRTYGEIIQGIKSKKNSKIYMWKSKVPLSIEDVRALMKD